MENAAMNMRRTSRKGNRERLSHLSPDGRAKMVDVGAKRITRRIAVAEAIINLSPETAALIELQGGTAKGDVLETARLAGIMAAKKTAELIPLCHPLELEVIDMQANLEGRQIRLVATAASHGRTGVEMEALTAVSVAALTVYDMLKSVERGIEIGPIRLLEKRGGKSGRWKREENSHGPR
jgi:cyclic pyranopterin phosphate synthase